ncbi:MAG: cytochrome c [Hyphomicrobiales bacterium]
MLLVPVSLLALTPVSLAGGAEVTADRAERLRNLVVQDCGSCHGLTLKGGLGKPLLPKSLAAFPEEGVAEVILDGVPGTPMPAWRGILSEADAQWIARTLKEGVSR